MTPAKQPIGGEAAQVGKRARTRKRIYEAAMLLFQERGYRETTIAEICEAAGIARATFFLHFPLKSALVLEWSRMMAAEWSEHHLMLPQLTPSGTLKQLLEFIATRGVPPMIALPLLDEFQRDFGEDHPEFTAPGTVLGEAVRLIVAAQRKRELTREIPARELSMHFHRTISAYTLIAKGSIDERVTRAWRLFAHGAGEPSRPREA